MSFSNYGIMVIIKNGSGVPLTYVNNVFHSGRLADTEQWPSQINPDGREYKILCSDKDLSFKAVSGTVTYSLDGEQLTFGFSNPVLGSNKWSVVKGGDKAAMNALDAHSYSAASYDFDLGGNKIRVTGSSSSGDVNRVNITIVDRTI